MLRKSAAALSTLALLGTGAAWAADAHAAPLPGIPVDTQLHVRLAVLGADRPTAVADSVAACEVLRTDGKAAALQRLVDRGYEVGFQSGYALGTMVDVACPDLVPVIR